MSKKLTNSLFFGLLIIPTFTLFSAVRPLEPRTSIPLNGEWEVEQGTYRSIPKKFTHTIVVPGLMDMAQPAFEQVGMTSNEREVFWYRKSFKLENKIPDVALLKMNKAKYGIKVYLNGKAVGEHLPCFTPAYFDVKEFLNGNGRENELIVRIGANREAIPEGHPSGWDFEKYLYIPGIYDDVELILSGSPHIVNVQVVPQIESGTVRVDTELLSGIKQWDGKLIFIIREKKSAEIVGMDSSNLIHLVPNDTQSISKTISIKNHQLWSPENPFLYELSITNHSDGVIIPFGMRSFRFDRASGKALLNEKPYMMRGTNVCIYRFFEDSLRGDKPWRKDWIERLHKKFKKMNWNSIRYCIGFPPEKWYDIADEVGFLIQDEFPIWLLSSAPENPKVQFISSEYRDWMRERWNHPCVVIWDAQNESVTPETGKAIQAVRHLDLSNRPWENGWETPQSPNDVVESHPYLFSKGWKDGKEYFFLDEMINISGNPRLRETQKKYDVPVIINEYAWLWLNRDGSPTTLTKNFYNHVLGEFSTAEDRFSLYARYVAALTEFWRSARLSAGVLHFCGLGYARSGNLPRPKGGATSDHFIDLENLIFEPNFEEYVQDAFSPLGLMLDFWQAKIKSEHTQDVDVAVINDFSEQWIGELKILIVKEKNTIMEKKQNCVLSPLDRKIITFSVTFPRNSGSYELIAEIEVDGKKIRSRRLFEI